MPSDAEVEIILKWRQEQEAVLKEVQASLAALAAQAFLTNLILRSTAAVTTDVQKATQAAAAAQTAANAATAQWYSPLQAIVGVLPVWVALVAGGALVLAPFSAVVLSAATALVSFAVAGAGTLALMGGIAAGFAAIGAGILFLGGGGGVGAAAALTTATDKLTTAKESLQEFDALHTGALTQSQSFQREQLIENIAKAQTNYNDALTRSQGPMGVLIAQLSAVKDAWAAQAAPMAATITQWVGGAIPSIQAFGSALMTWFGDRLPAVLSATGTVFRNLAPDFQAFWQFLGGVADKVGPQMASVFQGAVQNVLIPAATGAITNLVRLSDWFQKELPTLGPVVQQVLGGMGGVIQWVASTWAKWNDWIVANWKPTIDQAKKDWDRIADGWKGVDFSGLSNGLIGVGQAIKDIGDALAGALGALGSFIGALQRWADNNDFWAGLQGRLIDLGRWIQGVNNGLNAWGIDAPPGYVPPSSPLVGGSNSNQSGGVRTTGGGGGTATTNNTTHNWNINGATDPNLVARTVARNLAKIGIT